MVEFPPVYRPKPYSKPTAHLKSHLQVLLDDGAEIATFVYTPHASAGEKPCKDLTLTAAYLASVTNGTNAAPIVFLHGNGEEHGIFAPSLMKYAAAATSQLVLIQEIRV